MKLKLGNRQLPYNNPFANALVVVVGVIAIAFSFVVGVVAFFALAAAVITLGAIIAIRVWWHNRKTVRQMRQNPADAVQTGAANVIEGDYTVIAGEKDGDKPPQS